MNGEPSCQAQAPVTVPQPVSTASLEELAGSTSPVSKLKRARHGSRRFPNGTSKSLHNLHRAQLKQLPIVDHSCRTSLHFPRVVDAAEAKRLSCGQFSLQAQALLSVVSGLVPYSFMSIASASAKPLLALMLVSWLSLQPLRILAAPANSEELSSNADGRGAAGGSAGAGAGALPVVPSVPQSKTVELLLQMQDQPQPLGGDERSAAGPARRSTAAASAATPSTAAKAAEVAEPTPLAALKNAILRDATPRPADTTSTQNPATPGSFERQATSTQSSGAATSQRDPGQSLLSNPVIQYIRENRVMVVSLSLGVLAAIWLTASFSMRRGR